MTLYGLRLLVALLTFAVGVAAAWLFNFKSAPASVEREVKMISVHDKLSSCSLEDGRVIFGGMLQKKTIDKLSPAYPHYAKVVRLSGTVSVKVEVDEDGRVSRAKAVTGYGMLPEAAVNDALATRFAPTRLSGQPVKVMGFIEYNFVLD